MSIDRYDTIIDSYDAGRRIEELEEGTGWVIFRLRNDEEVNDQVFDSEEDARQYIEDEDYNPARVSVRRGELDSADQEELENLAGLREEVGSDEWTLYNKSFFDKDWAKSEAREALSGSPDFDEWPLNLVDWDEAASELRDQRYPYEYRFDGTTFYGEE